MLNQVVLVGRIDEIKENDLLIAVPRTEKNEDGIYDTDYIQVIVGPNLMENINNYCTKGDLVGVKGKVRSMDSVMYIIAEKITFLSTKAKDDNDED